MGKLENLIVSLYDVGAVKFGSFTLKSGIQSPIYFDLRVIISHPKLLETISEILEDVVASNTNGVDVICGVPYTALPLATIVSVHKNIPMIIKRKEQKKYGTGKLIEGEYVSGKTKCLIIEDVVTTGSSIIETTQALRDHGIVVDSAVVVLNRNYPAADENLMRSNVALHSIVKVDTLLDVLVHASKITEGQRLEVTQFLADGQNINGVASPPPLSVAVLLDKLNSHGKELLSIMMAKKSNLCVSADCEDWKQALSVIEAVGPKVCAVKTHVDGINFNDLTEIETFRTQLKSLAKNHNFMVIEDRKFADIGSTVEKQLIAKPYSIGDWAQLVTVHSIPGPGMLKVFKQHNVGVILIAEMSSAGNLPSLLPDYKTKTLELCDGFQDTVVGFVSQSTVHTATDKHAYLQFTPGVSLGDRTGDSLGQQYVTVTDAVLKRGADVVIVGRGIIQNESWVDAAEEYRSVGWEAFTFKYHF